MTAACIDPLDRSRAIRAYTTDHNVSATAILRRILQRRRQLFSTRI